VSDYPESARKQQAASLKESLPQGSLPSPRVRNSQQPRHDVDTSAVVRLIDLAADIHGRIVDVSLGGCHIRVERRFPVGIFRRVEVQFCLDGLPFRLAGVTQAVYDPFNIGIRFLDLSDRRREQLTQLIHEIEESEQNSQSAAENSTDPSLSS